MIRWLQSCKKCTFIVSLLYFRYFLYVWIRYTFFRQITTFIKVLMAFVFGLQTLSSKDFSNIYRLKGLKPKNKGHTDFYECCDLTKKVYLMFFFDYTVWRLWDQRHIYYYIPGVIPAFVCPTQKYNPESSDVTLTIV